MILKHRGGNAKGSGRKQIITGMKNRDVDMMLVGSLRTNKKPIRILLGDIEPIGISIDKPDARLSYELSIALKSFIMRNS